MDISKRLKELRTNKGLSQEELAEAIGVSPSAIGMFEQGRRFPKRETLEALRDYFNVSIDYLTSCEDKTLRYVDPELADLLERESIRHVLFAGGKLPDEILESYADAMRYTMKALESSNKQ